MLHDCGFRNVETFFQCLNVLSERISRGLATGLASELKIKLTPYTEDSPRFCRGELQFLRVYCD